MDDFIIEFEEALHCGIPGFALRLEWTTKNELATGNIDRCPVTPAVSGGFESNDLSIAKEGAR